MSDIDEVARQCLRGIRGCATDEQYGEAIERIKSALQDSFEEGWRGAREIVLGNGRGANPITSAAAIVAGALIFAIGITVMRLLELSW